MGAIKVGCSTSPQENQYYPFGMTIAGLDYSYENNSNRYLYNGKERQSDLGLNLYDYGARMYDPAIGRWSVVDPMADAYQAYSPYNYTLNNPIKFTDPNGMWVDGPNGGLFTDDPRDISDFMGSQQRNEGNDKTYEGGTLPEHSVNAPRAFDGVLGRAADKWRDNNLGYSTYGKRASEGLGYQTQWSQDFKVFLGVGYGMINNMLFASLGTFGYMDDVYGTYTASKGGGIANARALGIAGEQAVGLSGAKTAIQVGGRTRIPDALTRTTLTEVKNVKSLSFTRQLRDFHTYSQQNGLDFILYTRPNTTLSGPLQQAINNGSIIHKFIPKL